MRTCEKNMDALNTRNVFVTSLIAGGSAGTVVDITLFPLDTLKTRLQSQSGFRKCGGFNGLYKGIYPVIIGSAPTAAAFFVTYEAVKAFMQPMLPQEYHSFLHMGAASSAEVVACLIRVPVEAVKQRKQVFLLDKGGFALRFLYRGYWSTMLRDMPFSLVQFPLWEQFKMISYLYTQRDLHPSESAICGAFAGGIAAAVTTPLDVAKTRIMLASKKLHSSDLKIFNTIQTVYNEKGIQGLFAGIGPRVMWITLGGFIFFGVYEEVKVMLTKIFPITAICI